MSPSCQCTPRKESDQSLRNDSGTNGQIMNFSTGIYKLNYRNKIEKAWIQNLLLQAKC